MERHVHHTRYMAHHTNRRHGRSAGLVGRGGSGFPRPSRLRRCLHVAFAAFVLAEMVAACGFAPLLLGGAR